MSSGDSVYQCLFALWPSWAEYEVRTVVRLWQSLPGPFTSSSLPCEHLHLCYQTALRTLCMAVVSSCDLLFASLSHRWYSIERYLSHFGLEIQAEPHPVSHTSPIPPIMQFIEISIHNFRIHQIDRLNICKPTSSEYKHRSTSRLPRRCPRSIQRFTDNLPKSVLKSIWFVVSINFCLSCYISWWSVFELWKIPWLGFGV